VLLNGFVAQAQYKDITFLAWSDIHIATDQSKPTTGPWPRGRSMGNLDTWANMIRGIDSGAKTLTYPAGAGGGQVATPDFHLDGGDCTDWPTSAAKNVYDYFVNTHWSRPTYTVAGNHDDERSSGVNSTFCNWLRAQPYTGGSLNYHFVKEGVAFICHSASFKDAHPSNGTFTMSQADLDHLAKELAFFGTSIPIVYLLHFNKSSLINLSSLESVLKGYNVVLIINGHFGPPKKKTIAGYDTYRLDMGRDAQFAVFTITSDGTLKGGLYQVDNDSWREGFEINKKITGRGAMDDRATDGQ